MAQPALADGADTPAAAGVEPGDGRLPESDPWFSVVHARDDFADPASGWNEVAGEAAVAGYGKGDFRIAFSAPSRWLLCSNGDRLADALISVDTVVVPESAIHPYGVFLRGQDNLNFHAFVIGADGAYAAFHLKNGLFGMDGPQSQYLPTGAYRPGGVNRLAVRAERGALHYLLNNVPVVTIPAALWPAGTAGVIAANPGADWAEVHFDNWQVLVAE